MAEAYYPGIAAGDAASVQADGTVVRAVVQPNSFSEVFERTDTAYTTPLTVRTPSGLTMTKVPVGDLPIYPDVYVQSPNFSHIWKSGSLVFQRDSQDAKDKAVADALAAGQALVAGIPAEIQKVVDAGDFTGPAGKDGSNVLTTRVAVAAEFEDPASPSRAVLNTAIEGEVRGEMFMGLAAGLYQRATDARSRSIAVSVQGDSTNTPDWAWFGQLKNDYAAAFPAFTHHYRKWNDPTYTNPTSGDFDRPIVVNTGPLGRRAVVANGGPVGWAKGAGLAFANDLDIRVNLRLATWTPASEIMLQTKWTDDTSRSYFFTLQSSGQLRYSWTAVDDTNTNAGGGTSGVAVPFADGTEGWVRVVHDVDNGAGGSDVKFYTSTDGVTWVQLGTTLTTAGVTRIATSRSNFALGYRTTSTNPFPTGARIFEVQVRDGINGPNIVPYLPEHWNLGPFFDGNGAPTLEGSPIFTWLMAAYPGAGLGPSSAPAGQPVGYLIQKARKMSGQFGQLAIFYSCSHNSYREQGTEFFDLLSAYISLTSMGLPQATRVVLTQNPRNNDDSHLFDHMLRRSSIIGWARGAGAYALDTYAAFLEDGRPLSVLVPDGVHPSEAGYTLQKNFIKREIEVALSRVVRML